MAVTLSNAMPGYDPDFYGASLGAEGAFANIATDFSTAAGAAGLTTVDYAYKCGQGKSIYRCYGIGAYSHSLMVELQHQVNRIVGKKLLAEDGILGPNTLSAIQGLQRAGNAPIGKVITTLDQLAANLPTILNELRGRADQLRGGETMTSMGERLLDAMSSVTSATADEVAHDKATGQVPAGFQQGSVRMSSGATQRIADALGPGFAKAAQAAEAVGAAAGGPSSKRSTLIYVGVGVGLTAAALAAILIIGSSGRDKRRRA